MNLASMSSPTARLRAAWRVFDELQAQATAIYAEHKPQIIAYPFPEEHKLVFVPDTIPPISPTWPAMIRNIAGDARSSLDYLAYQLAIVANGDKPLDEGSRDRVKFPISKNKQDFDSQAGRLKPFLRPEDLERMEQLQVHNALDTAIWKGTVNKYIPHQLPATLRMLAEFRNRTEHREPEPVWYSVGNMPWPPEDVAGHKTAGAMVPGGLAVPGAPLAEWHFEDTVPTTEEEIATIDEERYLPIRLGITQWMFMPVPNSSAIMEHELLKLLPGFLRAVSAVLGIFEPAVERGEPLRPMPYWWPFPPQPADLVEAS